MAIRLLRFRRFSRQLMLLLAGLIALVQLAVYLLISQANERNAIEHIEQNLQTGARIFRQSLRERIDHLSVSAKLMSGDYAIKPLLIQNSDRQTLSSVLLSYTERVKAPVIGFFSPEGDLLALANEELGAENVSPFRQLIQTAVKDELEQASGYAYLGGKLYVLVTVPLYAPFPDVAAWFGLAYPIDTAFAQSIKEITMLDVTFTAGPDEKLPRVLSTTLEPAVAEGVAERVAASPDVSLKNEVLTLADVPYVTLFETLPLINAHSARIALQRSLTVELAPARQLEKVVLAISLAALGAALLAAAWIARGVSRPLQQLAAHTRHVAAGDYTQVIHLPREDELGQLATAFNQMTTGLAERDRVRMLLGKVVSPEIATQLLKSDLELGGEEREVTILFCDLRNFTGLSESLSPTAILTLLNRYLDHMTAIIEKNGGVIDKYIGDAIMALFGAPVVSPDAPDKAVATAREMARALAAFNRELAAEGQPTLAFGIGINTARVVAGNMGSKTRLNYTVIGDGVNLASRLEALTRDPAYATPIIISEATFQAMKTTAPVRELGMVKVKGKADAVKIFALL